VSASNWDQCPQCKRQGELRLSNRHALLEADYGKIPSDEYVEKLGELSTPVKHEDNLREDYEIGVTSTGKFYIHYSCSCDKCGFSHKFKREEQLTIEESHDT
jgi:hypothetical protein